MTKKIKKILLLTLCIFVFPFNVYAYSNYIYAGGENIGIKINSSGILIVGTYEINGKNTALLSGIKNGDIITHVNDKKVNTINEMISIINSNDTDYVDITYKRKGEEYKTKLPIVKENNIYKTGLYVKDSITGIGTLTYIDPDTKIFGALGHEISETNTGVVLKIKDGSIYNSTVTSIDRSEVGEPGSKNATLDLTKQIGNIKENTNKGIFGEYEQLIDNKKLYKVAKASDIKLGSAKILTVLNGNEVKEYSINIIKLNNNNQDIKNIVFEITDSELINSTGGVVQGMSGSPIIQGEYIIGAVTHVVVENPTKGYGILIENMLEEGEN